MRRDEWLVNWRQIQDMQIKHFNTLTPIIMSYFCCMQYQAMHLFYTDVTVQNFSY